MTIVKHSVMTSVKHDGQNYDVSISGKGIRISKKIIRGGKKVGRSVMTYSWEQIHEVFEKCD